MDNMRFTALCTGTGTLGGTLKGSVFLNAPGITAGMMAEVVFYAVLSAVAAYLTKIVLDRLMGEVKSKRKQR